MKTSIIEKHTFFETSLFKVGLISEKEYAYPISAGENFNDSYIIHFKGNNKEKMKTYYSRFFENKN